MTSPETLQRPLTDHLAEAVRNDADRLVEAWIEAITVHAAIRPARMLPRDAIRDHIPSVIRGIAESLRTPIEAQGIGWALRSHARLRYDQGFDIEELFREYRSLTTIVTDRMLRALEEYPGAAEPHEVGRAFTRLAEGLSSIGELTVAVYRKTELRHKQELHAQLEEYVRTITHELKQPLNAITAGAGMLEDVERLDGDDSGQPPIDQEQRDRYLEIIRNGVDRAARLIDDIRTLALAEGAQSREELAPIQSSVMLVFRQMEERAKERGVSIEVERALPEVDVDAPRVEIVLVNLLSNAIKYSDPEKSERWVRVSVQHSPEDEGNVWQVSVEDNGLGIPRPLQRQIFERHFRAHPKVDEGTGLGLSIARRVVEQVGGRIWFESEEGEGSTFHFTVSGYPSESADSTE